MLVRKESLKNNNDFHSGKIHTESSEHDAKVLKSLEDDSKLLKSLSEKMSKTINTFNSEKFNYIIQELVYVVKCLSIMNITTDPDDKVGKFDYAKRSCLRALKDVTESVEDFYQKFLLIQ